MLRDRRLYGVGPSSYYEATVELIIYMPIVKSSPSLFELITRTLIAFPGKFSNTGMINLYV